MVEASSDRVSEYHTYNSVRHQPWSSSAKIANGLNALTVSAKKAPSQTSDLIPNVDPTKRHCKFEGVVVGGGGWGRGLECKCIELVASTRKWKRLNQTIKILTSGDLGVI